MKYLISARKGFKPTWTRPPSLKRGDKVAQLRILAAQRQARADITQLWVSKCTNCWVRATSRPERAESQARLDIIGFLATCWGW
jgi:hypothetical protein